MKDPPDRVVASENNASPLFLPVTALSVTDPDAVVAPVSPAIAMAEFAISVRLVSVARLAVIVLGILIDNRPMGKRYFVYGSHINSWHLMRDTTDVHIRIGLLYHFINREFLSISKRLKPKLCLV